MKLNVSFLFGSGSFFYVFLEKQTFLISLFSFFIKILKNVFYLYSKEFVLYEINLIYYEVY